MAFNYEIADLRALIAEPLPEKDTPENRKKLLALKEQLLNWLKDGTIKQIRIDHHVWKIRRVQ